MNCTTNDVKEYFEYINKRKGEINMEKKRNYILFNADIDTGRIIAMTDKQADVIRDALEAICDNIGIEVADDYIGEEI